MSTRAGAGRTGSGRAGDGGPGGAGPAGRILWAPRDLPPLGPDVAGDLPRYREWARRREAARLDGHGHDDGADQGSDGVATGPRLLLVVVVDRPDPGLLRQCLDAAAAQATDHCDLRVQAVGPLAAATRAVVDGIRARWPGDRVHVGVCDGGTTAAGAVAEALAATDAPAFVVVGQHDVLAPDAAALLSGALAGADVAYGDEDWLDGDGLAVDPRLKPDWSPELLLSSPYLGRPVALRRRAVEAAGGVRAASGGDGDWEHDLLLRVTERTGRVAHVAEVLCHRRTAAPADAGPGAVAAALRRRGVAGEVRPSPLRGSWYVHRALDHRPSVTAVVPFRDAPVLLRACVDSVTATAGDVALELLLVDNGSVEPETFDLLDRLAPRPGVAVRRDPRPFNWAALNNAAAQDAAGEVLLFLNNDIEALRPGWLGALSAQALRPDVGAAGARLLYPGGRVQHAGVVLGLAGAAGHVLAGLDGDQPGYLGMAVLTRDCSAVTGACLATRRQVFDDLGGFDESLGLDVNDIDYCLRARAQGLEVVYEPQAELVHHESPSRGTSGNPADQLRFLERWDEVVVAGDPYLNRHLTRATTSPGLRRPGEEEGWWRWRSTLARS